MIEARELTKRYGSLVAVDRVSFSVDQGEVVGLLGPNGAGKTTVLKILTGYHFPQGGSARIGGYDVVEAPLDAKRRLGYLPENAPSYGVLTVLEYLGFIRGARGLGRRAGAQAVERVLGLCGLEQVIRRPIAELSKGYRQRVGLAQALLHDPQVVILDEPTNGLDPNQIREMRRIIVELGRDRTVLLSTHILSEVEAVCDRVLILDSGRIIAAGTAGQIAGGSAGRTVVEIRLAGPMPQAARTTLAELAELIDERTRGEETALRVALRPGRQPDELFSWAVAAGIRLRGLTPERDSLEEVFARLTAGEHG